MIVYVCCFIVFLLWFYEFFVIKNHLHVLTFIALGVFVPIFLYELNWSALINKNNCFMYTYIIVVITIITIVYSVLTLRSSPNKLKTNEKIAFTKFGYSIALLINVLFVGLYLLENYMGSGMLFPALAKVDIHNKYSAPIISYITNASFMFISFDYLAYKATKKKKYLVYLIIIAFIPIITRSSRFIMLISLIQLLCLYALFEKEKKEQTIKEKRKSKRIHILIFIGLVVLMVLLSSYTNYRMSGYGKYDITYASMTKWTGPEFLTWLSPFYGYFALSFNNLKINLLYNSVNHNYIGLYSFHSLYFGLLQLDNILGINPSGQVANNLITSGSANVPTGFWDYYYDYGYLFFIPYIIALLINSFFLKKSKKESTKVCFRTMYCWYVVYFAFMSFQNTLYMSTSLVSGLIMFFIIKNSFKVENVSHSEKN